MPITIDDIPLVTTPTTIKNSDVFYASMLADGNPSDNYINAKNEINLTGDSTLVNEEKTKWVGEQLETNKRTVEEIISDPSVPLETRQRVMENYVKEATPIQDLRNKFLIETAVRDASTTVEDREQQDDLSDTLSLRDQQNLAIARDQIVQDGALKLSDVLDAAQKTTGTFATGLLSLLPAGIIGGASLIFEQNPEKADELIKIIQEKYTYTPEGELKSDALSREVTQWVMEGLEVVDAPFKWVGDRVLELPMGAAYAALAGVPEKFVSGEIKSGTGDATAATGAYLGSGGLAGTVLTKGIFAGGAIAARQIKGKPSIKRGTPLDTIETASKEQASELAAKIIADPTERTPGSLTTTKAEVLNTYVLPKLTEEFGPIKPDVRESIKKLDEALEGAARETEISAHVYPVSQILSERELYSKVLLETERPHLLLSSSVLDIPAQAKLYGRSGKGYEALLDSSATKLEGTAVFGRNGNFGYKTEVNATKYMKKLEESVKHLPDPGQFSVLEREGQYYVSWKFTREYKPHESLIFGDDTLSAHLFAKKIDITDFANGTIGKVIFPSYMRMKSDIAAQGAAAAREESRIESIFLREARDTFIKTDHPKELESALRKGEEEGKSFTAEDIQLQNPHLTKVQTDKIHGEYIAYRRIVDHLYNLTDRQFRKNLVDKNMKSMYNNNGEFVAHTTEPLKEIPEGITYVWDLEKKAVVKVNKNLSIVQMNTPIKEGDHILNYAQMPTRYQFGPIRSGALTKIPGYIPRSYKEWFVVDKVPKAIWVDGKKVGEPELRDYKQAVAMAGNREELNALMERLQKEDPSAKYEFRKEEKDINDKIMHDSQVYDTYLKQIHRRGDRLPSLDRPSQVEDVLVALTKAIRSTSKMVAWDDLTTVRRDNFIKAYGKFTQGVFPKQITDIKPIRHMTPKEERDFLSAQSVYAQIEREQISSTQSDIVWRNGLNKIADIFETKTQVDASVLREWGEKGFIPARTVKAFGSNLFLYWRPLRMWVVQPQQWKELVVVSPAYAKHLKEILPITNGLLSRTQTLRGLKSMADNVGARTVPEYNKIISALEESGIVQSVDMNQMVHGIWKDATKELAPQPIKGTLGVADKAIELASTAAGLPGKLGRGVGYNPSELVNQVSLWLFARHRWIEKNPGKNWDTPENRATIARDQSLYSHISATRAGMYGWQEGMISTFTQFVAIPWKSTLQMVSSHQLTGAEKARLAGARLFWYGKYGVPLGAVIYKTLDSKLEDKQDRETLAAWTESATDRIWNVTLGAMFDKEGEETRVDTKNLSTSIDGEYVWEVMHTLIEMGKGNTVETPKITFPYENATGSLFEAVRSMYDIFKINDKGAADIESWKAASWKAVSFAGTFSDFNKAMLSEGMSKAGNHSGYQQTRGEAVARVFGIPPTEESILNMATLSQIQRYKEIQNTAKQIHKRLIAVMAAKSVDEKNMQEEYLDGLGAFLNTVPEYYKEELTKEIFKLDRNSWREKKESVLLNLYRNANDSRDTRYLEMRNALEKSSDPEIKSMLRDLEEAKKRSVE